MQIFSTFKPLSLLSADLTPDYCRMLTKEEPAYNLINVENLLAPSLVIMINIPLDFLSSQATIEINYSS